MRSFNVIVPETAFRKTGRNTVRKSQEKTPPVIGKEGCKFLHEFFHGVMRPELRGQSGGGRNIFRCRAADFRPCRDGRADRTQAFDSDHFFTVEFAGLPEAEAGIQCFCRGVFRLIGQPAELRGAAWLRGDETKYMPWSRVKEEAFPTVRGDFMPTAMRKTQKKQWGYGIDPKVNNRYCSTMFVSDAGLTQKQCEWEKEEMYETSEINNQIAVLLAELRYLEKTNPRLAVQLAQNEAFLKRLHLLRSQSESFWNFSSLENASMLGGEAWIRQMKRELPDLMFRIQILGQKKGAAKDGFYSNFDIDIHGYAASDADTERLIFDKHTHVLKGKALDAQKWPTPYETMSVNYDECQAAADTCALDVDVDYTSPLLIAIDANAKAVADYRSGKEKALKALVGFVMKNSRGQADAAAAESVIKSLL